MYERVPEALAATATLVVVSTASSIVAVRDQSPQVEDQKFKLRIRSWNPNTISVRGKLISH